MEQVLTPTLVKSSFLICRSANAPTGEERDTNMERHFHIARSYPLQCSACYGSEESTWTFERRICFVADDGLAADRWHWRHSRQQEF
jgi:hypothetical protein